MIDLTLLDKMNRLEIQIDVIKLVLAQIMESCSCSASERYSGHLVECPIPKARDIFESLSS